MNMRAQMHDLGLLILRVAIGGFMVWGHGAGKVTKLLDGNTSFPDPLGIGQLIGEALGHQVSLGLAVFAEFLCSILVVIGLFTPLACVPLIVTMLVAVFVVHGGDPWAKKELALLYAVPFLTILLTGPGRFSIDAMRTKKK